jgi:hypothetical protein
MSAQKNLRIADQKRQQHKARYALRIVAGVSTLFFTPLFSYILQENPKSEYRGFYEFALNSVHAASTGSLANWATLATVVDAGYGPEDFLKPDLQKTRPRMFLYAFVGLTVASAFLQVCKTRSSGGDYGYVCSSLIQWTQMAQVAAFVGVILFVAPPAAEKYSAEQAEPGTAAAAGTMRMHEQKRAALAQAEAKLATASKQATTASGTSLGRLYYHTHAGIMNTGISVNVAGEIVAPPHIHSSLPWGTTTYYRTTATEKEMADNGWKAGTGDLEGIIVDKDGKMVEEEKPKDGKETETHTHDFSARGGGVIASANFVVSGEVATTVKAKSEGMKAMYGYGGGRKDEGSYAQGYGIEGSHAQGYGSYGSEKAHASGNEHREFPMSPNENSDLVPSMQS